MIRPYPEELVEVLEALLGGDYIAEGPGRQRVGGVGIPGEGPAHGSREDLLTTW
jgi:hypothetical protein